MSRGFGFVGVHVAPSSIPFVSPSGAWPLDFAENDRKAGAQRIVCRLLSRLAAFGFARGCGFFVDWIGWPMLPYFDRRAAESPRTADAEARYSSFAKQAVNRSRMDAKMRRQIRDGQNIFRGRHRDAKPLRRRFINSRSSALYRSVSHKSPQCSL